MKKLIYSLSFFVFLGFAIPAFAQMQVTPTVYCLGSCPTTAPSGTTTSPTQSTNPTVSTTGGVSPTSGSNSPAPTVDPCASESEASIQHNKKKKKHKKSKGGFWEMFMKFIMKFIEKYFGGGTGPGNPSPTTAPSPTDGPGPTDDPTPTVSPCPSPSDGAPGATQSPTEQPTQQPTNVPSIGLVSPTTSQQPSTSNAQLPAQVLNLSNWKLTLPSGPSESPTEIKQPALATYKNDPFFLVSGGGVKFRSPVNGVTTGGSSYPRSELREMTNNGSANAAWTNSSGTHTMFIEQAIMATPKTKKHVVAGQIHDASDDVIVIRLEGTKLFVDIGGTDGPTLDANYTLGKKFTVKFEATGGKTNIYYNGSTTPAHTLSKSYSGAYFKAGAYTQSNCSTDPGDCSANNYGEVIIYKLEVTHN
jgi:hypothetical protein